MFRFFGSKKHPRGPDWSKGREHCLDFSGTKFYFYVPDYTYPLGSFKPKPEKYNIYDESIFCKSPDTDNPASFLEGGFLTNWQFKGSPLFGRIGGLKFSISITRNISLGSLNRPENFIAAMDQWLNYTHGPWSTLSKGYYQSVRKNWRIQNIAQTRFACYDVYRPDSLYTSHYWKTPISDEHYLAFAFHTNTFKPDTAVPQAYNELIARILDSMRIEWSTDALKQQAIAKEKWPNEAYPEQLPELKWSDEEWLAHESDEQREDREFIKKMKMLAAKQGG